MADINVVINPAPEVDVSIGKGIEKHGTTHAPGASDSLENYYAQTKDVVYNTGNQIISGNKSFYNETYFQSGVNLSGKLIFNTGFSPPVLDGEMTWNSEYNTVQIGMNGGDVVCPIGFKSFYRVKANQVIRKGKVIMSVGTVGNSEFILAQEAANIGLSGELIMGVSSEDIAQGQFGDVVSFGPVKGVNTSSFTSGDILYFDAAATGEFTNIPPAAPNAKVIVALNLHPANNGTVFVRVSPGSVLGGTDSNVKFSALKDQDFISYNQASGYWYNKTLTTGDVSGISNFTLKSETGQFYPASNPSGYVSEASLSGYVTGDVVRPSETGNFITKSETGNFYPSSNPSGFITGVDLSNYVTGAVVRPSETGEFLSTGAADNRYALQSNTGAFVTTGQTGSFVTGSVVRPSETGGFITSAQTGQFVGDSETGAFYPASNPSGFITGVDLSNYVTGDVVRPSETGSFITAGQTGQFVGDNETGAFYPASNPSGFITGVDLSNYVTGSVVRPSETGNFITSSQTGQFYPNSNPSGYITGVDLSSYATTLYVTGISGHLQTQITNLNNATGSYVTGSVVRPSETGSFITTNQTGAFYPASNPSGFITGVDLSAYVTGSVVRPSETGAFLTTGAADSRYVAQSATGNFITTGQTGAFAAAANTGAFLTTGAADSRYYGLANGQSISGYAITGFNDAITGITVTGDTTKTITLFQRDNTTLTASFTDNAGSGSSDTGYLTGYVSKTETGNIAVGTIGLVLDGGGSTITTGYKSFTTAAFSGEILSYTVLADRTGSIVIDVWKDTYANYPLTSGDSICATNKVTLATGIKNTDSTLTSWIKTFSVGDNFGFNVDSVSGVQKISLTLRVKKA